MCVYITLSDSDYVYIFKEMPFLKSKHQTAHYIVFFPLCV